MLEDFKRIPTTNIEADMECLAFREINQLLVDAGLYSGVVHNWESHDTAGIVAQTLNMLKNTKQNNVRPILTYTLNDYSNLVYSSASYKETDFQGVIINEEAATHFHSQDFMNITYLEKAQEYMKQTSQHFLRIFTATGCNIIYVYTNKPLQLPDIYKLLQLCEKVFPQNNELFNNIIDAFIKQNVTEAKRHIIKYLTSDEVVNIQFKQFRDCIAYQKENLIRSLITQINEARDRICRYETNIATLASDIRSYNDQIAFQRSKDTNEEDDRAFFNYLMKSPYIKKFNTSNRGNITFEYTSPIIYFNEYPAEKILTQDWRDQTTKNILKIILGRKYTLWTKCKILFDLSNFQVNMQRASHSPDLLPQPHIDRYGCFGNHLDAVRDAAEAGNYLGAIEQITQATMNVNFYDTCVVDWMLKELDRTIGTLRTWKCEKTGEWLTANEILKRGDYYEETQSE